MKALNLVWRIVIPLVITLVTVTGPGASAQAGRLAFTLDAPPYRQLEAEAIVEQLNKLGVQVEVQIWDKAQLRSEVKKGKRIAYLTDWGSAFFDPFDLAQPKLTTGARGNFSFYSNRRVDELMKNGSTSTDPLVRKRAYHEVQEIIYREAPWAYGYTLPNIESVVLDVVNYIPSMDNRVNLHDVEIKIGDTIVVGMNTSVFVSLDPAMHRSRETETMIRNIFDGLVTRTHDGKVVPELAESWRRVDDTTFVFTLRRGPRFHNGDPVTADDVVFTFDRVLKPNAIDGKSSPRKGLLGPLAKVKKISHNKVRFVLKKPFPPFLQALVHFQIVPKRYIRKVGDRAFGKQPIGAGPFKFVRGKLDVEVVMERFADYYGGSPEIKPVGRAKIKRAVFKTMPEPSTRVAALLAGEASIIQAVPPDLVEQLAKSKSVQILLTDGTRSYQMEFNNQKPPFNDPRVRKALNYAIDWETILSDIYRGYGRRLATCFLPSGFGYNPNLKPYPYDPGKAKKLFKEAGYEVK